MNKKAEVSDWGYMVVFLFLLILFFGSVVLGVKAFFGEEYDFRDAEAEILFSQVRECFMEEDFSLEGFDIFEECGFNENLRTGHMIYISGERFGEPFVIGVGDFVNQCDFEESITDKNNNFPKCVKKKVLKNGEEFDFVVGSNQKSRRILG